MFLRDTSKYHEKQLELPEIGLECKYQSMIEEIIMVLLIEIKTNKPR